MGSFSMQIKAIRKSRIKLQEFNYCPGRDEFFKLMHECGVKYLAVNITNERKYQTWRNGMGTAVFMVSRKKNFQQMLDLCEVIQGLRPEEFNYTFSPKGNAIFRLWWD